MFTFGTNKTLFAAAAIVALMAGSSEAANTTVGDICRVKGQESVTLHGMGIVVGLGGTGDGEAPTKQAFARVTALLGGANL